VEEEARAVKQGDAVRTCCGSAPGGFWFGRGGGVDIDVGGIGDGTRGVELGVQIADEACPRME
jgi:hypothetical protein